jgi:hypothetical protein
VRALAALGVFSCIHTNTILSGRRKAAQTIAVMAGSIAAGSGEGDRETRVRDGKSVTH